MNDTHTTPQGRIDNLCLDLYVAAVCAKQGRLNTEAADRVATRLRSAAAHMIENHDAELLRAAAGRLEAVTTRVKAQAGRPRVKAEISRRRETPSIRELISQENAERMASAGPFDRTTFEDVERERIAEANRQLRERQGRAEELRSR